MGSRVYSWIIVLLFVALALILVVSDQSISKLIERLGGFISGLFD